MKSGLRVVMSEGLVRELEAQGRGRHADEFGGCIGIVEGPANGAPGDGGSLHQGNLVKGSLVQVRWQPGGAGHVYRSDSLVPVQLVIAIDGPAASGKGTLARRIAEYLGFPSLDTGLLYRAVARDVMASGADLDDEAAAVRAARSLDPASLQDPGLRDPGVGEAASRVARIASVRSALLEYQRDFARRKPGVVLDGRDIGTVVCPDADIKIFVEADVLVRADRRYRELRDREEEVQLDEVRDQIRRRDERDMSRSDSPMRPAADATLLDTTNLDIEAAFDAAMELIKRKIGRPVAS